VWGAGGGRVGELGSLSMWRGLENKAIEFDRYRADPSAPGRGGACVMNGLRCKYRAETGELRGFYRKKKEKEKESETDYVLY
jgi:hypothetical protein